jgi:hypothetical protein
MPQLFAARIDQLAVLQFENVALLRAWSNDATISVS